MPADPAATSSVSAAPPPARRADRWQVTGVVGRPGFADGHAIASLRLTLQLGPASPAVLAAFADALPSRLQTRLRALPAPASASVADVGRWFVAMVAALSEAASLPTLAPGRLLGVQARQCLLSLPCPYVLQTILARLVAALAAAIDVAASSSGDTAADTRSAIDTDPRHDAATEADPGADTGTDSGTDTGTADPLMAAFRRLVEVNPHRGNTDAFLRAARALDIPFRLLTGPHVQYGLGRHGRWMNSSFSDATSGIGSTIARDKQQASTLLRMAGLPVPAQLPAVTVDEALRAAAEIGYPVVVKPRDLDGGVGVSAGLETPEEVRTAVGRAQAHRPRLLVERHVPGRDYRINVFHGEVIWAIERVPGGLTGDGRQTVRALLNAHNADPLRPADGRGPLYPLRFDAEAETLLAKAGLTLDSVPAAGRFVPLRRICNIAAGGTPVAVLDRVHPDNRALAIRAAALLRLDIAGIDLLIPDIAVSWLDSGAAICEVNAQPNIGLTTSAHLYGELLAGLVHGNGRVPTIVMLGAEPAVAAAVEAVVRRRLPACGRADASGLWLAGQRIGPAPATAYDGGVMLACHPEVEAIVVAVSAGDHSLLRSGSPFDRIDLLIVAAEAGSAMDRAQRDLLRPLCTGTELRLYPTPAGTAAPPSTQAGPRAVIVADGPAALTAVDAALTALTEPGKP